MEAGKIDSAECMHLVIWSGNVFSTESVLERMSTLPETNSSPMKIPIFPGFHTIKMVDLFHGYVSLQECNLVKKLRFLMNSPR